jgi:hypothetical protein
MARGSGRHAQATVFCVDCDRLFCDGCNAQRHLLKADSLHAVRVAITASSAPARPHARTPQRTAYSDAAQHRAACPTHPSQRLRYFCLSCNQAICADCRILGAHPAPAHDCTTVDQVRRLWPSCVPSVARLCRC